MTKEKTTDEIREEFLAHVWHLVDYWGNLNNGENEKQDALEGLAFSILSTLDGSSAALPGFIVAPMPHETDKEYHMQNGEDYYPYNDVDTVKADIAGSLHELFYAIGKKEGYK